MSDASLTYLFQGYPTPKRDPLLPLFLLTLQLSLLAARAPHSNRQVEAGMGRVCLELQDIAWQPPCRDRAGCRGEVCVQVLGASSGWRLALPSPQAALLAQPRLSSAKFKVVSSL